VTKVEDLNTALERNEGIDLRAERAGSYLEFFVKPVPLRDLENVGNRVAYGRRGSGKTLLLRSTAEIINQNYERGGRSYAFSYDAQDFQLSPRLPPIAPTVLDYARAYFRSFLSLLAGDVFDLVDEILKHPAQMARFNLIGDAQAARRDRLATKALELAEASNAHLADPDIQRRIQNVRERLRAQAQTGAHPPTDDPWYDAFEGARHSKAAALDLVNILEDVTPTFTTAGIRQRVIEIVELLGLDHFVIMIDEWMTLRDTQIDFAEELKFLFFASERISVKLAVDRFQCELNNSASGDARRGIEVGADVFIAVNLDEPFRVEADRQRLFAEALYRRLLHCEPGLAKYFGPPESANLEDFITSIFATPRAFDEVCFAAHGLCRDFNEIFKFASKDVGHDLRVSRITVDIARDAIGEKANRDLAEIMESVAGNALVFNVIRPHVMKTQSRFFAVRSEPGRTKQALRHLAAARIIHPVDPNSLDDSIFPGHDVFEVEYGFYLKLMRAMAFSVEVPDYDPLEGSRITSENLGRFFVDSSAFADALERQGTILMCAFCSREFSRNSPAFKLKGYCPFCFEFQTDSQGDEPVC
jgi:hypothetical protein